MITAAYFGVVFMTGFGALGALFFKRASSSRSVKVFFKNYNLYIGIMFYLFNAILNILLLRTLEYSILIPLTSINFIWSYIFAYFFLKEKITILRYAGIALIIVGMVILII